MKFDIRERPEDSKETDELIVTLSQKNLKYLSDRAHWDGRGTGPAVILFKDGVRVEVAIEPAVEVV